MIDSKKLDLLNKVSQQMHDEIMGIIHVYARMVVNSDDMEIDAFQYAIFDLGANILAGVIGTYGKKDEDSIKEFVDVYVVPKISKILEENDIEEVT